MFSPVTSSPLTSSPPSHSSRPSPTAEYTSQPTTPTEHGNLPIWPTKESTVSSFTSFQIQNYHAKSLLSLQYPTVLLTLQKSLPWLRHSRSLSLWRPLERATSTLSTRWDYRTLPTLFILITNWLSHQNSSAPPPTPVHTLRLASTYFYPFLFLLPQFSLAWLQPAFLLLSPRKTILFIWAVFVDDHITLCLLRNLYTNPTVSPDYRIYRNPFSRRAADQLECRSDRIVSETIRLLREAELGYSMAEHLRDMAGTV